MALTLNANVLGLIVSGDVADSTIYTDRFGRKTVFPKSPPKEPPSPLQVQQRERFRLAQNAWMALTPAHRQALENATRACSLALTGQNLYIAIALRAEPDLAATIERQSGITLPPIPYVHYPAIP